MRGIWRYMRYAIGSASLWSYCDNTICNVREDVAYLT